MAKDESNGIKRLVVGLVAPLMVLMLIQTGTLIWWCSNINTRMNFAERDIAKASDRICILERGSAAGK